MSVQARATLLLDGDKYVTVGKTYLVLVIMEPSPSGNDMGVTLSATNALRVIGDKLDGWFKQYQEPGILFEVKVVDRGVCQIIVDMMYGNKYAGTIKLEFTSWT